MLLGVRRAEKRWGDGFRLEYAKALRRGTAVLAERPRHELVQLAGKID
jgi:hypothetical protein